jgi:hypothetical protein
MRTTGMNQSEANKPSYLPPLEAAYGKPSQSGFGSAVFFEQDIAADALEKAALAKYQYFVGEKWLQWGEKTWMAPWKQVYARPSGQTRDVVAELEGISDPDATSSVDMVLNGLEDAKSAQKALSDAFNHPAVENLSVFNLGDGEAMSGILIAGRCSNGDTMFLVFLMD